MALLYTRFPEADLALNIAAAVDCVHFASGHGVAVGPGDAGLVFFLLHAENKLTAKTTARTRIIVFFIKTSGLNNFQFSISNEKQNFFSFQLKTDNF